MHIHECEFLKKALEGVNVQANPTLKKMFGLDDANEKGGGGGIVDYGPGSIAVEISEAATLHLLDLAISLRRRCERLRRAASPNKLVAVIGDYFADQFHKYGAAADLSPDGVMSGIQIWLDTRTETRDYIVPCRITRTRSPSFSIGPVTFCHLDDYKLSAGDEHIGRRFREYLDQNEANWIATVTVPDRAPEEAERVADAAVDMALAGLQLMADVDDFNLIGRCSANRPPNFRMVVSTVPDGRYSAGYRREEPGLSVQANEFERLTQSSKNNFPAIGRCIRSFLSGTSTTMALDAAWCEAAYLYHEALAQPLPTLRAAGFETCLEVLLKAENTRGSKRRLMEACDKLLVLPAGHIVETHRNMTADQFVKSIVEARSRVLHGTWSTFSHDLPDVTAASVRRFARVVLIHFAAALADYSDEASATDDLDQLLSLAFAKTTNARAARQATAATAAPGAA